MMSFAEVERKWEAPYREMEELKASTRIRANYPEPVEEEADNWRKRVFPISSFAPGAMWGKKIHKQLSRVRKQVHMKRVLDSVSTPAVVQKVLARHQPGGATRAFLHVDLRYEEHLLQEVNARDEFLKLTSLHPILLNNMCRWCKKTANNKPVEDHAVSCTTTMMNNLVGKFVEKEISDVIGTFVTMVKRMPRLNGSGVFVPLDPLVSGAETADLAVIHRGIEIYVDITFASQVGSTRAHGQVVDTKFVVDEAEANKISKYESRHHYNPEGFLPFGVDCQGRLGKRALKFLRDCNDDFREKSQKQSANRSMMSGPAKRSHEWRNAMESISLTVCRANGMRMRVIRDGFLPNGLDPEEAKRRTGVNKVTKLARNAARVSAATEIQLPC